MNTENIELISFSVVLAISATFILTGLIKELAPAQKNHWFLGVALGSGVAVFSLKIIFIVAFSSVSAPLLEFLSDPAVRQPYSASVSDAEKIFQTSTARILPGNTNWRVLPEVAPAPADNPVTEEKVALGKALFFDKRLSLNGNVACASCHIIDDQHGGADGEAVSTGILGQTGSRNAPTVLNAAFQKLLFWDGRAHSLEEQALGPLINPVEMGMPDLDSVEKRVASIDRYPDLFAQAFPEAPLITRQNIARAIASFERTLITPDSPYDRFVAGDASAMTRKQIRGMALFESSGCTNCHSGPNFSDASVFGSTDGYRLFPANPGTEYEEKYELTRDKGISEDMSANGRGLWRIPSLRNVARTAPYFHNGSVNSLEEAVRIMARVQLGKVISESQEDDKVVYWSGVEKEIRISEDRALTDNEVSEIVAFLHALNGKLPDY